MNILKRDCPLEKKVQQVEKLMDELGLKLHYGYDGLQINHEGKNYPIVDTGGRETCVQFPRMFEHERLEVLK